MGAIEGHAVPLDYTITLSMIQGAGAGGGRGIFRLPLLRRVRRSHHGRAGQGGGSNGWVRTHYQADPAFQQEILDLLLAQPYEAIPAT